MSDVRFPELPGLDWNTTKTPEFNTKVMTSINGRELRASYQAVPKYTITLAYTFLRERQGRNELQQLESFFYARRGSFDSFLFKMPDDYAYQCRFIGDAQTTQWRLYKETPSGSLPLSHVEPSSKTAEVLMWNQSPSKAMWSKPENLMWQKRTLTIQADGIAVITPALEQGQILQNITGTYYYRCRFKEDSQQYTNFAEKLWSAKKVELIGSLGNKV